MDQKVRPAKYLKGTLQLPPDKSIAHRSAMFAAISEERSVIHNYSDAADPQSTLSCLQELGVPVEKNGNSVTVHGVGRDGLKSSDKPIDCGNSGTTMRLLSGIIAGAGLEATLIGDSSLSRRTMKRIITPLRMMGARITARDDNYAPIKFSKHKGLKAISYPLPVASAQLKSCILLAGLFGDNETTVIESVPSRNHTEVLLGLPVEEKSGQYFIHSSRNQNIPAQNYTVPGDFSAASFWLIGSSILPDSSLKLVNVGINQTRIAALNILRRMGADIKFSKKGLQGREEVADLIISYSGLKATDISEKEIPNCIDEIPILGVAMAFADGTSKITGAAELRHKECDRLSAMAHLFNEAGVKYEELSDGFIIHGNPDLKPNGTKYNSFDDHRIAMSAAILSLRSMSDSTVVNAESSRISYPDFWDDLDKLTN